MTAPALLEQPIARHLCAVFLTLGIAGMAAGQTNTSDRDNGGFTLNPELDLSDIEEVEQTRVATAPAAVLRGLDKVSGELTDIEIRTGETLRYGRLTVQLGECRYPQDNPSGDAFGFLKIQAQGQQDPAFLGWMIASSPALNALDHPRYDVWILRCKTS